MRNKKFFSPSIASLMLFGWMFFFFSDVFIHPNDHLFNEQGDGIKAFYVFADHIKNDESYHQLRNMNYPYGQTHIFTDGQTIIANTLKLFSSVSPFFQTHCIGIYNYLIICSFILCAFFLALIFQRFGLPKFFVIVGSFCIAVMSPQIWRISGHPTLSYAFFFPLAWLLLMNFLDTKKKRWLILILILNTTFWFFVHPYLGMVITIFYFSYLLAFLLQKSRKELLQIKPFMNYILLLVVPLLVFKIYSLAYDHHEFRSQYPWGFWVYYTTPGAIFIPHGPPFDKVFEYFFKMNTRHDMEKLEYVGLAADAVLLFTILKFIRYVARRKTSLILNPVLPKHLNTSLWASVLVLLFAMCIPFKFGLQAFVDQISFLRQFRSLGRFAWAFYYVCTVYSVFFFWLIIRFLFMKRKRAIAYLFIVLFFSFFVIEAYPDFKERARWAVLPKNPFIEKNLGPEYTSLFHEINRIKKEYQCLVPLPFFHVGTENFGVEYADENIKINFLVCYWCNIPSMANSAARSPIMEGKNIMQFFSPPFIKKEIQKDLPSKKDFLLLCTKEPLNEKEAALLNRAQKIFDNGKYELWKLPYEKVFTDDSRERWNEYLSVRSSLIPDHSFELSMPADIFVYHNFDSLSSENSYRGNGALQAK